MERRNGTGVDASEWWTLDPIDGTVNFAHDVPLFAVSLAPIRDQRPVLGVADLPAMDSRYWAAQGHGAHRDGRALKVRDVDRLDDAVLAIGDYAVGPGATDKNRIRLNVTELLQAGPYESGCSARRPSTLRGWQEGRLDASVTLSNRSWDAAGVIIAREAGAVVLDYDGSQHTTGSAATIATAPDPRRPPSTRSHRD